MANRTIAAWTTYPPYRRRLREINDVNAPGQLVAPSALRARVPRANSSTIVVATNAENVYATSPGMELPAPRTSRTIPVTTATPVGHRNVVRRLGSEARRQATSGPIPISSSSGSPKMRRKKS